mmetsp:Transcript_98924/g.176257  ORF Transcript_98924/g.176257 Transcript_98924/m.176257 type:complete len:277 (+) Transcript_98924:65-895(+)|eukprot:CAMPEP_0197641910 /NCGR_PEP_ID=MMETSP1338-20131121/15719_1 /TAXON_ID=43686 ORGANISM="Pelagodinium beii, Strain RCC1491" /NCGR_SAMPLE_ID=MMETSP1338 /ASSEMBLY_ACC=CAM_ASM_000754 /LENGTH=276 /DNA_ID=CAMNT_0043214955 /DNA_START=65 /DNA_END=895 /DNA_ORIENTATION=-
MARSASSSPRRLRGMQTLLAASCAVLMLLSWAYPNARGAADTGEAAGAGRRENMKTALGKAMSQISGLRSQVEAGNLIPKFGSRAEAIIADAGAVSPELAKVVEGALEPLFLAQASILRQKVAVADFGDLDAVEAAEERFLQEGKDLTAASWSLEPERQRLRDSLEHEVRSTAGLAEERARAALAQRSAIEVMARLQDQMEQLVAKSQGSQSKSPWVLSTSYRIPKTPLQFFSKYEQGRADVELTLSPDKDPSQSEGSITQSIGPARIGLSFDVGF